MPLLFLRGVTQTYTQGKRQVKALDGLDLDVYEGEFLVIMGPSGSGKSTLLNIIAGLDQPQSGEFRYKNFAIPGSSSDILALYRQRVVGIVFQKYNLLQKLSARFNLALPRIIAYNKADDKAIETLTEILHLDFKEKSNAAIETLSQGQQQRVAIARSLVNNPEIIIADEPTGNLDSKNSEIIGELFHRINKDKGKTIIFVTHNPDFKKYADRVVYLKDGKVDNVEIIHDKKLLPEYNDIILTTEKPKAARVTLLARIAAQLLFSEKKKLFSTTFGVSMGIGILMMTISYIWIYYQFVEELPQIASPRAIQLTNLGAPYYYSAVTDVASDAVSQGRKVTNRGLQNLASIPNVSGVYPIIAMDANVHTSTDSYHFYIENGPPVTMRDPTANPLEIGSYFNTDTEDSIIISKLFASKLTGSISPEAQYDSLIGTYLPVDITIREYPGDQTIHIKKNLIIRGVFKIPSESEYSEVSFDFGHLISTNTLPYYTNAVIMVNAPSDIPAVEQAIHTYGFNTYSLIQFADLQRSFLYIEAGIYILSAAFGIFSLILGFVNLLSFTTYQKQKNIAALFAIGLRNGDIRNYIIAESVIFGIVAGVFGCIIAYGCMIGITDLFNATLYIQSALPKDGFFLIDGRFIPMTLGVSILVSLGESFFIAHNLSSHEKLAESLRRE